MALIFSDRRLGAIMAVTVIYNVFAWPFTSMIPVIGTDRLLLGPEGVGLLTSIDGVGAFVGCFLLALWLTPGWHARAYVGGTAAYLVGLIGFAAAPTPLLAGVALLVTGLAGAIITRRSGLPRVQRIARRRSANRKRHERIARRRHRPEVIGPDLVE